MYSRTEMNDILDRDMFEVAKRFLSTDNSVNVIAAILEDDQATERLYYVDEWKVRNAAYEYDNDASRVRHQTDLTQLETKVMDIIVSPISQNEHLLIVFEGPLLMNVQSYKYMTNGSSLYICKVKEDILKRGRVSIVDKEGIYSVFLSDKVLLKHIDLNLLMGSLNGK